jgi:hypothetical protein
MHMGVLLGTAASSIPLECVVIKYKYFFSDRHWAGPPVEYNKIKYFYNILFSIDTIWFAAAKLSGSQPS